VTSVDNTVDSSEPVTLRFRKFQFATLSCVVLVMICSQQVLNICTYDMICHVAKACDVWLDIKFLS